MDRAARVDVAARQDERELGPQLAVQPAAPARRLGRAVGLNIADYARSIDSVTIETSSISTSFAPALSVPVLILETQALVKL